MARTQLLGLFVDVESASESIRRMHAMQISDENITVLSGAPLKSSMLARPKPKRKVGRIALLGALLGVSLGLFLSVGIFLLYQIPQGGQGITPIPPTIIVLFEATMLGTMWSSFFGLLKVAHFPIFKRQIYDPRISEGYIGEAVELDEDQSEAVREMMLSQGAADVVVGLPDEKTDPRHRWFWLGAGGVVTVLLGILMLMAYNIIRIPFPTQMDNQESVAYLQGPRKAAPADAIPITGPVLVDGQPASTPVPSSADSIGRGKQLFTLVCAVCHGAAGDGKSPIAGFFTKNKPADLTSAAIQAMTDAQIYLVITNGFGDMPSMAENLSLSERWDVINFVRTLKK